jgi:hypothetical protein
LQEHGAGAAAGAGVEPRAFAEHAAEATPRGRHADAAASESVGKSERATCARASGGHAHMSSARAFELSEARARATPCPSEHARARFVQACRARLARGAEEGRGLAGRRLPRALRPCCCTRLGLLRSRAVLMSPRGREAA